MKRSLIFVVLSLFVLPCLRAQSPVTAVGVAEIAVQENDAPFRLVPIGKLGVLVVMEQNDLTTSRPQRSLFFYDENLHKRWQQEVLMESRFRYVGHRVDHDTIRFAMMSHPDRREGVEFVELAVCLMDGNHVFHSYATRADFSSKAEFAEFKMSPTRWYFLVLQKNEYVYCVFDTKSDTLYQTPLASNKEYTCLDWQPDAEGNACFLFRDAKLSERNLYLKKVSEKGEELQKNTIESPRQDLRLVDAKLAVLGTDHYFVGGSWNMARAEQTLSAYDIGSETMGLFALRFQNGSVRDFWMKGYLEYPDLDTLLSTDEKHRFAQAKSKANGRLLMPDYLSLLRLQNQDGRFRLIGEVYERIITTTTETSYDFYGRMLPYTRITFEGYRYKDAFYSVFDSSLANLQNSVFDLEQPQLHTQLQPLSVAVENAQGDLLYAYHHQANIHYRVTRGENGIEQEKEFGLSPLFAGDRLQQTWNTALTEWFPGCLLAYGYKQVTNTRRKGKNRQSVFYMNKVMVSDTSETRKP